MKIKLLAATSLAAALCLPATAMAQALPLFDSISPRNAVKAEATSSQTVRVNRRALNAPAVEIDLFGEKVTAVRDRVERHKGSLVWVGRIGNNIQDRVVITARGNSYAALINYQNRNFELVGTRNAGLVLNELDLDAFPSMEPAALPEGGAEESASASGSPVTSGNAIQQDLLVAYTDDACVAAGGTSGSDCSQVESQIQAAVVEGNQVYLDSQVNIVMNVVGMNEYVYDESGKTANQMLDDVTFQNDGQLEQVHVDRDALGADLVALITQSGGGYCGIAWVGSSQSYAFSQTARGCLSNRTLTHELGHNQGSLHARSQYSNPPSGNYNYGFRRCNNGGVDDPGSAPYFSTVMAYSCSGAARIGLMANPNVLYSGIPSGVDPDVDPANAAYSARTLNESAANISSFRDAPVTTVPDAPTGLSAAANGFDAINIGWTDNASNETSFTVERSTDGSTWSTIATLGSNATSFADDGLNDDTTYFYRVSAANAAGSSAYTNTASATTDPQPSTVDDVATGQIASNGSVSGSFADTHADDGVAQSITEASSGGPKRRRKQSFTHDWTFNVTGGAGGVVLNANAWVSGSEAANFAFSTDGGSSYTQMFTVSGNDTSGSYSYVMPGSTSGNVRVRATDAAQTNGEGVDSLSVDQIIITSNTEVGDPPANPSNMVTGAVTAGSVAMSFMDNADNEFGFEIWRASSNPGTNCNAGSEISTIGANAGTGTVGYTDTSAAPSTTYWYWAKAYNGAGDNGCSNAAEATTSVGAPISVSLSGYKVKGKHTVDVSWSGASTAVDIFRDGGSIATNVSAQPFTDNIGAKGGASYSYMVCETGTSVCSDPVGVTF
ncbi:MAG: hypothetical protein HKO02_10745 [Hyphomonadaceae bacterium]|nr:hypothetical protein [Hyphomonadaceae bacterium]